MATEHVANNAIRRALELREKVVERLQTEVGARPGMEEVSTKQVRSDIRAASEGDPAAMARIIGLANENGHENGEQGLCPVCEAVAAVMEESAKGRE